MLEGFWLFVLYVLSSMWWYHNNVVVPYHIILTIQLHAKGWLKEELTNRDLCVQLGSCCNEPHTAEYERN